MPIYCHLHLKAVAVCPANCGCCTRAYMVGANTDTVTKCKVGLPQRKRWDDVFAYIEATPQIRDVVVSGGDTYMLEPQQLTHIGNRLLEIPHIQHIRFASKGLAVAPARM